MANDLTLTQEQEHDFTDSELQKINNFKMHGLPGVSEVTSSQVNNMIELYLDGSTYTQISKLTNVKKIIIMYLSHIHGWYPMKKEYLNEIQENIKNRVVDTKLRNQEFMLLLVQAWQKKIGTQINKYLASGESEHMEVLDIKEISQLMKAMEMVNELDEAGKDKKGKTPAVGLNVGDGVVIEKTGENQLSITPKESSIGDILKQLADGRREEEKQKLRDLRPPTDKE